MNIMTINGYQAVSVHAVLDFETTGLSPSQGARPTEIAIVLMEGDKIVDRYQSLMNPGVRIPYDIQLLTGITDEMVRHAPQVEIVMRQAAAFVGNYPLAAHNASFDRRFWDAEMQRLKLPSQQQFACSMLLSRRLFPHTPNHKLGTLIQALRLPDTGRAHRALADAESTAHLLARLQHEIRRRFLLPSVSHKLLLALQATARGQLDVCVDRHRNAG